MSEADDQRFMAAALRLSRWHEGQTMTNPSVGCVLVRDGAIVGAAVTARDGRPHAEARALAVAGEKARGATAYVTLEPCAHHGKTPPCANALVAAGVSRVVVSVADPDPRVSGQGLKILHDAGIATELGLMEDDGKRALAGYLSRQIRHRPYVTLKLAVSADGMLGRRGEEVLITGPLARAQVHVMRAESDAILVGMGTVRSDDPQLTVRLPEMSDRSPVRVILDRRLELPLDSLLVKSARDVPVIVACVPVSQESEKREKLLAAGVDVIEAGDLAALLDQLATRGISLLFVEGGATVGKAFLDVGLVDRIVLSQGPTMVGEGGLESPLSPSDMPEGFQLVREDTFGPDRSYDFQKIEQS
ncbi:bifunctional diaminohydroxyphosphoribosylaminopyrimidine deaminase/5-amino-6-(5-phosphoribosylamino)uracil reductase RibD [Rhizobium sp. CFBP 13726]|uniref:bifunctional diaminohydroxyphosphoribosylaminopyrimidine deaminase/5-amino-6-(5-phosphoribosylamino)uracil reductase RibD n=1 Tax=Rhizobium sp. CFBP 13726 TaxID=2775296 RepID=UPI001781FA8C|nr:bifunctional diaminohydroxyphosphoribosylaminopyrimidine deaminase/5-amino-6-(5-phosphoribosylamino)uracil reductase RibD [Rhizobium sp. CFBP 13726]MBD8650015.1 bifunctional diaminohydroxyphosphoribosylaminopyrimidine deaminase/5-amino-6-(5-phosphoribosylamino)uracil reductase RibD [Rhizobium sp. CFBP 13726]